jgi:hypothetical protein
MPGYVNETKNEIAFLHPQDAREAAAALGDEATIEPRNGVTVVAVPPVLGERYEAARARAASSGKGILAELRGKHAAEPEAAAKEANK